MKIVVRVLAVIGALALVLCVAGLVWFASVSRPSGQAPAAAPTSSGAGGAGGGTSAAGGVSLTSIRASAKTLTGEGGTVRLTGLDATGVVPFAAVAAKVGQGVQLGHDGSGHVRMTAPVEAFGRTMTVQAVGTVRPEGANIAVEPESVHVEGSPDFLDGAVSAIARKVVSVRQPVEGLPAGASIADLTVADDGFHAHLVGENVTAGG